VEGRGGRNQGGVGEELRGNSIGWERGGESMDVGGRGGETCGGGRGSVTERGWDKRGRGRGGVRWELDGTGVG